MVRCGTFDAATRWAAHEVIIDSFRGQFGFVPRPHDEWVVALETQASFDWSQLTLLEVDGRAIAVRVCNDGFVERENCGHIGMPALLEEFRGRGLATFLLRDAFALDATSGRAGTILHVDTNNPPRALALYLSVGMKPTLISRRLAPRPFHHLALDPRVRAVIAAGRTTEGRCCRSGSGRRSGRR